MLNEPLVRSIKCDGAEVNLELLFTCAYIEFMSLDGAQLILEFSDYESLIRDEYGFKAGAMLEVEFDDFSNNSFTDSFEILTREPAKDGLVIINAMQKSVALSKVPAQRPNFFVDKSPVSIIKALLPDIDKWEVDNVNGKNTYHLLQGMPPSQVIRKIERDLGISVFVLRGVGYIKLSKDLGKQDSIVTLEYNNPAAEHPIAALSPFDLSKLWAREVGKAYFSWSMVGGLVIDSAQDGTPFFVPNRGKTALKNLRSQFLPVLNLNCFGSLQMLPSKNISMIFHRLSADNVIDESLPDKAVMTRITHFQSGLTYSCSLEVSAYERF